MICPNCNSSISDNAKFCPECGATVSQDENFNNYFAQDNSINNNYYNSQNYQQNNLNGTYPNNDYYNQQQFAPVDAGEGKASASMICGILSLFMGPILSIVSLVLASMYKKSGNGQNASKVKVGKICSWISIVSYVAFILFVFAGSAILMSSLDENLNFEESNNIFMDYEDYEDTDNDWLYDDGNSSDVQSEYVDFSDTEDVYYSEDDKYYSDNEQSEIILYEKQLPANGKVIYDKNGIKLTLTDFYLNQNVNTSFQQLNTLLTTEFSENYNIDFEDFYVNNEKQLCGAFYVQDGVYLFPLLILVILKI